jgi:hypothetical protein
VGRENILLYSLLQEEEMANWGDERLQSLAYFLFATVIGRSGGFQIVDAIEQIPWNQKATIADKRKVLQYLRPLSRSGRDADGRHRFQASLVFKNALFVADILFANDRKTSFAGVLEITDEELLLEDLPIEVGQAVELVVRY